MSAYLKIICQQLHSYRELRFSDNPSIFDRPVEITSNRPPVFLKEFADQNVLTNSRMSISNRRRLLKLLPNRHRSFRSMKSSQALTQSLFGNLIVNGKLDILSKLRADDGQMLFGCDDSSITACNLEYTIDGNPLKERSPTEIDVFFPGEYQVAVECKFTEHEVGSCSIPKRKGQECDGNLRDRSKSSDRCYLKGRGIKYWECLSELFKWEYATDSSPCPLQIPYQLIRNVLSVSMRGESTIDPKKGHAVLIFDNRNPAFQRGGKGDLAWEKCKDALKYPHLLQRVSWQEIISCLKTDSGLKWLVDEMAEKYGIDDQLILKD